MFFEDYPIIKFCKVFVVMFMATLTYDWHHLNEVPHAILHMVSAIMALTAISTFLGALGIMKAGGIVIAESGSNLHNIKHYYLEYVGYILMIVAATLLNMHVSIALVWFSYFFAKVFFVEICSKYCFE